MNKQHKLIERSMCEVTTMIKGLDLQCPEDAIAVATALMTKASRLLAVAKDKRYAATIFYAFADTLVTDELDQ